MKVKESHLFQIKLPHLFADITVRCFQKIKSSTYSHQPFEGISKKNPLGFFRVRESLPQDAQRNIQGQWTPRNMSPSPPSHFGGSISEVGTFERIALHSTFVRGETWGFRMFSGAKCGCWWFFKTTMGCAVQKKNKNSTKNMGTLPFSSYGEFYWEVEMNHLEIKVNLKVTFCC